LDLSHAFDAETIFWPTEEGFVLTPQHAGVTDGGYYYESHLFRTAEHGGTHLDAPIHFAAEGQHVDEIPLERLVGPAVQVDVSAACARDRNHAVTIADLRDWETAHGEIPAGAIVLLRTGFGAHWPDRKAYLGSDRRGPEAVAELRFPGIDAEAARWLVDQRSVSAVGLDTASLDPGTSQTFESHRVFASANVPGFENLANLDRLPPRDFTVVALPMKIRGGSGAPLRIIALVP
jgi:kynurenine formamidase